MRMMTHNTCLALVSIVLAWGGFVRFSPAVDGSFGASALAAGSDEQAEWDRTVEAAKKEGRVFLASSGGAGSELRRFFTEGFQKQFPGITVDLTIGGGRSLVPRVLTERRAGKFLWDVFVGGTTTPIEYFIPPGVLDPIGPALMLPEVIDKSKWFGSQIDFADEAEKHVLVFGGYLKPPVAYNSQLVKGQEIRSHTDLLDPKWRGKISLHDPRGPGSGLASVTFWYGSPGLGKDFIRRLFAEQELRLVRDYRQQLEWLARGDQLIAIGHNNPIFSEFVSKGLPLAQLTADDVKEGTYLTAAVGSVSLVNRAPHPNAAKVYINWLLSRGPQTQWSKAAALWSRRVDVPSDHLDPGFIPKVEKLSTYQANYKEKWVQKRQEIAGFLREIAK